MAAKKKKVVLDSFMKSVLRRSKRLVKLAETNALEISMIKEAAQIQDIALEHYLTRDTTLTSRETGVLLATLKQQKFPRREKS